MTQEVTVFRSPAAHTLEELARWAAGPLERAGAQRAVAFGSYARGTADGFSDLDLAVVLATDRSPTRRWRVLSELLDALPVTVDLLVYTPQEFARGMERRLAVFDAIAREGVTIYARSKG